jgi:predicted RNase H-like HicB family nuclease
MKYAVVYEKSPRNYAAYVPDLPGCVATGTTRGEIERNIREAIAFHLEGLRLENQPVPEPQAWAELVEV